MPNSAKPTRMLATIADPEVAALQQAQTDERLLHRELDPDEGAEEHSGDDREFDDKRRCEPVVLFALLEHGLKRRQPDRHRRDPGPIAFPEQPELHRLLVERQRQRDDHDRTGHSVDEEDRLPAVVLSEIAADGRPYRRGEGHREGKQREADRLLRLRQFRQHDGEGHRYQNAAGEALQPPHHDHGAEVVSERAADREQRKQHRVDEQVTSEREHSAQVVGQRDDDDLADQIGGRDPGAVVDARSDAALDIEQRGVGDLDVENRHEGADHAGENGDPVSRARACRSSA